MDEQMIECLDAHEAALSGLVDKLFAAGAREAGLLVSQASATVGSLAQEIRAAHSVMSARLAELEEALKPFADQMTTAELLHNPDRSELTPEHRIERMGERKRERDANILRARAALAPHPKADE